MKKIDLTSKKIEIIQINLFIQSRSFFITIEYFFLDRFYELNANMGVKQTGKYKRLLFLVNILLFVCCFINWPFYYRSSIIINIINNNIPVLGIGFVCMCVCVQFYMSAIIQCVCMNACCVCVCVYTWKERVQNNYWKPILVRAASKCFIQLAFIILFTQLYFLVEFSF